MSTKTITASPSYDLSLCHSLDIDLSLFSSSFCRFLSHPRLGSILHSPLPSRVVAMVKQRPSGPVQYLCVCVCMPAPSSCSLPLCKFSISDCQVPEGKRGKEGGWGGGSYSFHPAHTSCCLHVFFPLFIASVWSVCVFHACAWERVKPKPESCVTQSLMCTIICTEFSVYSSTKIKRVTPRSDLFGIHCLSQGKKMQTYLCEVV